MIRSVKFTNFKNFQEAELICGPLTLLIGANASGKSNARDAFRFLHGIGRGYSLAEIVGEKYGPGSELVWDGIRGGMREIAYRQADTFALKVKVDDVLDSESPPCVYEIEVAPNYDGGQPQVVAESLYFGQDQVFKAEPFPNTPDALRINVLGRLAEDQPMPHAAWPALTQFVRPFFSVLPTTDRREKELLEQFEVIRPRFIDVLGRMRFLEPAPKIMSQPSTPGQEILGDRGEHLAAVLQAICANPQRKAGLLSWLRSLTPMDVVDLEFASDVTGKVLLMLIEKDGQKTSAYSASGGTLRFLVMLAALLGPQSEQLFFFEELENGIHPARLHLLLKLIEKQVVRSQTQVIATTHSPQLLRLVNSETLKYASLIYRLPDTPDAKIKQLSTFPPEGDQIIKDGDIAELYDSGWFENMVYFMADEEEVTQ